MVAIKSTFWKKLLKDKDGNIIIWQSPNLLLYGWFITKLLSYLVDQSDLKTGFETLSYAFLFTWAYLEATRGVNYIRRILGLVILVVVAVGFFTYRT